MTHMITATNSNTASLLASAASSVKDFAEAMHKMVDDSALPESRQDHSALCGYPTFVMLLFFYEFDQMELDMPGYGEFLSDHKVNTPGNMRAYPLLSQSALFEIFAGLDVSRETIRRLLIGLAKYGLISRVTKGPPYPDQLGISQKGREFMTKVSEKRIDFGLQERAFAYL